MASLCIIILPFTAYDITFVDNTPEQCTIRNKQITGGNAKYSPSGDQIINNQGGKKLLQVKFFRKLAIICTYQFESIKLTYASCPSGYSLASRAMYVLI